MQAYAKIHHRIALFLLVICLCSSCGVFRAAWFLLPDTDDYRHDPHRLIAAPDQPFHFFAKNNTDNLGRQLRIAYRLVQNAPTLDEFVTMHHTHAFLIIRNDTILYQRYPNDHAPEAPVTTFSVTKSVVATLVGIAIQQGHLRGMEQRVAEVLPEWAERGFPDLTVGDLLQHSSGISFSKSLVNLNSDQAQFYYGRSLRRRMARRRPASPPGEQFDYHSANTLLLAMILEKQTGQTLSQYLENVLWHPLGAQASAFWSLDRRGSDGIERAFCCLQAQAIDFAKLGRLWLHDGNWQGRQLLPRGWIENLIEARREDSAIYSCGFSVTGSDCNRAYFASGLMGQFIYVVPDKNLLILRFGQHRKGYSINMWQDIFGQIAEKL